MTMSSEMNSTLTPNVTTEGPIAAEGPMSPLEMYVLLSMLGLLSVFGTAGNAVVIYVFSNKNDNQTSTIFIIGLAIVDMLTCAVVIPFTLAMEYLDYRIEKDALCKTYQFLVTSNVPFSAFIMAAIAVDRYLCICHPFLHAMTLRRAKMTIGCLGLLSATLGIIVALAYGVYAQVIYMPCVNGTETLFVQSKPQKVVFGNGEERGNGSYSMVSVCKVKENMAANHSKAGVELYHRVVYDGSCIPNELIISAEARKAYQKIHVATFLLCLLVVAFLYALIYKSVLDRRRKRAKMRNSTAAVSVRETSIDCEETQLTTLNGHDNKISSNAENDKRLKRKSTKKDKNRMQNIKTAIMLFVVTVVFVVTFLPAALMANFIIPYNGIVFYLYFANNIANPVIYSFMNKNFRDDLKKMFNCQR